MLTLSIDVSLLDKARFKTFNRKNGTKGTSCDLVLVETPNGQYGDYMVKQSITKEEREAGVQLPILGNAKNMERGGTRERPPVERRAPSPQPQEQVVDKSDLPF